MKSKNIKVLSHDNCDNNFIFTQTTCWSLLKVTHKNNQSLWCLHLYFLFTLYFILYYVHLFCIIFLYLQAAFKFSKIIAKIFKLQHRDSRDESISRATGRQPVPIISARGTRANSTNWPCIVFARASAGKSRLIRPIANVTP